MRKVEYSEMKVQFSSIQSLDQLGRRGDMTDDSAETLFHSVLQVVATCEKFRHGHGQGCSFFDVLHPAFPLPTTMSPTLQSAPMSKF